VASGRTHDLINLAVLPVAVYYLQPESFTGFVSGYLIGTFFLSPDNDIYHSKPNKRWKFLRFIWLPYTKIFSHRGISHLPVVGLAVRLAYILILLFLLVCLFALPVYIYDSELMLGLLERYGLDGRNALSLLKMPFTVSFFIGLLLAEIVHITTDVVYSTVKRLRLIR